MVSNCSTNTADHTFSYELAINASGNEGWLMYDMFNGQRNQIINTGTTNTPINMSPFPVDQNGSLLLIMDAENTACIQSVGVNMNSCVYTGACDCCR